MGDNILGEIYQQNTDNEIRKSIGQYYTPNFVIKYILENTVEKVDIIQNPFISIIDISCGAGYFLTASYDILKEKFLLKLEEIRDKYKDNIYTIEKYEKIVKVKGIDYWQKENIHYHILKHCIYGADKDGVAVDLTKLALLSKEEIDYIIDLNIVECDSLVRWENNVIDSKDYNQLKEFWSKKYDISIGNPPYIGHKQLSIEYKEWLLEEYKDVFKDKSDISFCFFQRILEILSPKGISGIITSRYFMESPTGKELRLYLKENTDIFEIVDFYGAEIFKDVKVATAIYLFKKHRLIGNKIKVHKLINDKYKFNDLKDLRSKIESDLFSSFQVEQDSLELERWILISERSLNIYKKIERKTRYRLGDIANSFQGIITGCDKAFVLNGEEVMSKNIEKDLLKRWIKNSNIERYNTLDNDLFLIYSDLIEEEGDYPRSIKFIKEYKTRLEKRRECKTGSRKWYELQWGRDRNLFEQPKIIFPYKSRSNRFTIDYNNLYYSADIYSLVVRDEFKDRISLEYLVGLLNSSIYEFYFKLFAKKMGKGIYDYYPNSILDLKIIMEEIVDDISENVNEIMKLKSKGDAEIQKKIYDLEKNIDEIIGEYFELDELDYEIINNYINK
ncbi:N-6 DNA methylase [Tissierella sp. MB52-C2]|uniref:Eco57I restriction-modification methylase domain-containing protein n=1 Tax=Tissierella sp. MB52-C2 TaxID=3070999 RepID=UPI00280AD32E|nr:N-6 DNA methylase [Tissierella sp. MB52-C2]WMM23457.1 N-6 DNA methylase [Tissierella sp. MB52-C2]